MPRRRHCEACAAGRSNLVVRSEIATSMNNDLERLRSDAARSRAEAVALADAQKGAIKSAVQKDLPEWKRRIRRAIDRRRAGLRVWEPLSIFAILAIGGILLAGLCLFDGGYAASSLFVAIAAISVLAGVLCGRLMTRFSAAAFAHDNAAAEVYLKELQRQLGSPFSVGRLTRLTGEDARISSSGIRISWYP
jgi:hypothetical protein